MTAGTLWTKEAFEASVTGRAWVYTEYDEGWDRCKDSAEIRALFAEEMALGALPAWASEIVDRMLTNPLPACGHYTFPRPILQACEAIGREDCADFVIGCYTADSEWKRLSSYYVFCLDAWLREAALDVACAELELRDDLGKDWNRIVESIYETLGARSEQRVLLVRRLIHRLRWWLKTLIWSDDARNRFILDNYLGDVRGSGEWGDYGNAGFHDPYFAELKVLEVQELASQIRERVADGEKLLERIESTWLCAPKVFRYLERLIIEIGSVGADAPPDFTRSILQCEDTYPDLASCKQWHTSFMSSLAAWLEGDKDAVPELGKVTPVKHWLVRMMRHRLQVYEGYTQYIGGTPEGRSGRKIAAIEAANDSF